MKLLPAPDDLKYTMLTHRLVSENELVEMGVFRVLYGWRVRAGFIGDIGCTLDWCGGGNWQDVERLYSICFAILSNRNEDKCCFNKLPTWSTIKPFYLDHDFVRAVSEKAGEFELLELERK